VPEDRPESENITESIEQENASSIRKIRSMFIDPSFAVAKSDDAVITVAREALPDPEASAQQF
jgi:hypothetical protein